MDLNWIPGYVGGGALSFQEDSPTVSRFRSWRLSPAACEVYRILSRERRASSIVIVSRGGRLSLCRRLLKKEKVVVGAENLSTNP